MRPCFLFATLFNENYAGVWVAAVALARFFTDCIRSFSDSYSEISLLTLLVAKKLNLIHSYMIWLILSY